MATTQIFRQRPLIRQHDRRRFQRVNVTLLGRFMLADRREYPCQTTDATSTAMQARRFISISVIQYRPSYLKRLGRQIQNKEGVLSRRCDPLSNLLA